MTLLSFCPTFSSIRLDNWKVGIKIFFFYFYFNEFSSIFCFSFVEFNNMFAITWGKFNLIYFSTASQLSPILLIWFILLLCWLLLILFSASDCWFELDYDLLSFSIIFFFFFSDFLLMLVGNLNFTNIHYSYPLLN